MSQNSTELTLEQDIKSGTQMGSLSFGSKHVPIIGFTISLLASILAGILIGILLLLSSLFFYIYFIQPLIAAFFVGLLVEFAIKKSKMRHTQLALILGLLAGLILYGTYRYGDFINYQRTVASDFRAHSQNFTDAEFSKSLNERLIELTGSGGFVGYLQLEAQKGLTYSLSFRGRDTGETLHTSAFFAYLYWVLEFAIVLMLPAYMSYEQSKKAFCVDENKWLELARIAYVAQDKMETFLEAVKRQDFESAVQLVQAEEQPVQISIGICNQAAQEAMLKIVLIDKKKTNTILEPSIIPGQFARDIMKKASVSS